MIAPDELLASLEACDVRFVTGVPDSLLKDVCAGITAAFAPEQHVIATNEGSAIALAIGHYLGSGRPALVYMQNSGLGNSVNPLASLVDPRVFGIPMVLMIGWRAELGPDGEQLADEPQHVVQGRITTKQLDLLGIPFVIVDGRSDIRSVLGDLTRRAMERSGPTAMVVRKKTFQSRALEDGWDDSDRMTREEALITLVERAPADWPIVATTGHASRELFELRRARGEGHSRDLLTVGGMGHALQIAVGIALARPEKRVLCIDGDGALLMHTGALAISANQANLVHVVMNNGAHDSVGGQPTLARSIDLTECARAFGYGVIGAATSKAQIEEWVDQVLGAASSSFLEIKCRRGSRPGLGRPDRPPAQNKADFMEFLRHTGDPS